MTSSGRKFYVVWKGRRPGVYETWDTAAAQVNGFAGARFKAYPTKRTAEHAWRAGPPVNKPKTPGRWDQLRLLGVEAPILPSYSVDAACSGNPGVLEYRGVRTETGKLVLERGPFPEGTNNIGEFLAIVELLMWLTKRADIAPVYSDSVNALAWVRANECKTQLLPNARNADLFKRIRRAEKWLRTHTYANRLLKWDTPNWGENPADYGRK
jgi:ribonuclease HI